MVSPAPICLLHYTAAACVILVASRIEQLEKNLKALDEGALPPETVAVCDEIWAKLREGTSQYNR